jgi:hypothetical protein
MKWPIDPETEAAAREFPLRIISKIPIAEAVGSTFEHANWRHRLRPKDEFLSPPAGSFPNCPRQIIAEFRAAQYLPALALVVSWGDMQRTAARIYKNRELPNIHKTLRRCATSIEKTHAIGQSWQLLVGQLQWTSVMASKTLHFLSRAVLPRDRHPPVPIDGAIIRNRVWWCFRHGIPAERRPLDWDGDTLEAYYRYMTAMLTWAEARNWTTTELEATIFAEYR